MAMGVNVVFVLKGEEAWFEVCTCTGGRIGGGKKREHPPVPALCGLDQVAVTHWQSACFAVC